MIRPEDIRSLTEFKRNTLAQLNELRKSGRPRVLTVNGKARLVVIDPATFQKMLDEIDRAETIVGVRRGMESFARGEGVPARAALTESIRRTKAGRKRGGKSRSRAA